MPSRSALGLALLSGALYWVAFPPRDVWPLAFVCWVPLLLAVERQPRAAFVLGWVQGLTSCVRGAWLFDTARSFFGGGWGAGAAVAAVFFAYYALFPAVLCALYTRAVERGWPRVIAFPVLHAACEYAFPSVFPWCAAAQVATCPVLMQGAVLGGPIAVGVELALANAAATEVLLGSKKQIAAFAFLATPVLMATGGLFAIRATDRAIAEAPSVRIASVQPNSPHAGAGRKQAVASAVGLTQSLRLRGGDPPALVLWPETVASQVVTSDDLASFGRRTLPHGSDADEAQAPPVLLGAVVEHPRPSAPPRITNSAILFRGRDAEPLAEYEKRSRLAFGEYIPFGDVFPGLYRFLRGAGHLDIGTSPSTFLLAGHRVAPMICYEDMSSSPSLEPVRASGAELLVTLTDDAWFGRGAAPAIHLALAKYRAVEHGRYLIRSGNQAGTAVIDPAGRVTGEIPAGESGALVRPVRWLTSLTLHDRLGDVPWVLAIVVAGALVTRSSRHRQLRHLAPHIPCRSAAIAAAGRLAHPLH